MNSTQELLDSLVEGSRSKNRIISDDLQITYATGGNRITYIAIEVNMTKLKETILSQREKGFAKYGKYIEDTSPKDYNWEIMTIEEIADALVYYNHLKSLNNEREN